MGQLAYLPRLFFIFNDTCIGKIRTKKCGFKLLLPCFKPGVLIQDKKGEVLDQIKKRLKIVKFEKKKKKKKKKERKKRKEKPGSNFIINVRTCHLFLFNISLSYQVGSFFIF